MREQPWNIAFSGFLQSSHNDSTFCEGHTVRILKWYDQKGAQISYRRLKLQRPLHVSGRSQSICSKRQGGGERLPPEVRPSQLPAARGAFQQRWSQGVCREWRLLGLG